jgi:hypothetical protein
MNRSKALLAVVVLILHLACASTWAASQTAPAALAVKASSVIVYITDTGAKYHKDGCRYLRKSKIKTTLQQAKADGYTACKVCKPPK